MFNIFKRRQVFIGKDDYRYLKLWISEQQIALIFVWRAFFPVDGTFDWILRGIILGVGILLFILSEFKLSKIKKLEGNTYYLRGQSFGRIIVDEPQELHHTCGSWPDSTRTQKMFEDKKKAQQTCPACNKRGVLFSKNQICTEQPNNSAKC